MKKEFPIIDLEHSSMAMLSGLSHLSFFSVILFATY